MHIASILVIYFCSWWVVIFCVLPWGVRPHEEQEHGTAGSAPQNPQLKKKFLITSLIAAIVTAVICFVLYLEPIDFYDEARQTWQERRD